MTNAHHNSAERACPRFPRLISDNPSPSIPAPKRARKARALRATLVAVPSTAAPTPAPRPGTTFGRRELRISTQGETRAWRAFAADHEAARLRLNALLPNVPKFCDERALGIEPAASLDAPEIEEAIAAYRKATCALLQYSTPKPRNFRDLIRAAAELALIPDPAMMFMHAPAGDGGPETHVEFAFVALSNLARRAEQVRS